MRARVITGIGLMSVILMSGWGCGKRDTGDPIPDLIAWPELRGNSLRSGGPSSGITPPLYLLWTRKAGRSPATDPCLIGHSVVVAGTDRKVRVIDVESGDIRWQTKLKGTPSTTPVASRGLLFVGHEAPRFGLVALSIENGDLIWTRDDLAPRGSPLLRGDTLFVAGTAGWIEAILASTGDTLWRIETDAVWPGPMAHETGVLVTCDEGDSIRARSSRDGRQLWAHGLEGGSRAGGTIQGGRLYVAGTEGMVLALDVQDGEFLWQADIGGRIYAPAAADSAVIYVTGLDGRLLEIAAETGEVNWTVRLEGSCRAAPAVAGDVVVVPTMGAVCQLISRSQQRIIHTVDLDRSVSVGAVVAGRRLYTVDEEGKVYAYESS